MIVIGFALSPSMLVRNASGNPCAARSNVPIKPDGPYEDGPIDRGSGEDAEFFGLGFAALDDDLVIVVEDGLSCGVAPGPAGPFVGDDRDSVFVPWARIPKGRSCASPGGVVRTMTKSSSNSTQDFGALGFEFEGQGPAESAESDDGMWTRLWQVL
jgi:hypothetical protein